MIRRLFLIFEIVIVSALFSCRTSKQVASTSVSGFSANNYINNYKDISVSEMKRTGIPASITLAQGMIESDYGRSTLAIEANNHFGIKCHNDWTGPTIRHHDDKRNDCFRKYRRAEDSFYDHSDFLTSGSRYRALFDLEPTDYKAWARGLKKAGYATNPDYANMLIRKIEENNLWTFDRGYKPGKEIQEKTVSSEEPLTIQDTDINRNQVNLVTGNTSVVARVSRIMENNRIQYIIVKDDDTLEKLEKEFQLLKWELSRYNELDRDFNLLPGQILYLQPKRDKAERGKEYHITLNEDTMYLISQRYGIKLKKLYEMNRMEEGSEPEPGSNVWLRSIKPVN